MSSKFAGVLNAIREPQETQEAPEAQPIAVKPSRKATGAIAAPLGAVGRPRGHAGGKSSDPNYTGTTAYILKKTHDEVKIALIREGEGREYSELVEDLLQKWLNKRPTS